MFECEFYGTIDGITKNVTKTTNKTFYTFDLVRYVELKNNSTKKEVFNIKCWDAKLMDGRRDGETVTIRVRVGSNPWTDKNGIEKWFSEYTLLAVTGLHTSQCPQPPPKPFRPTEQRRPAHAQPIERTPGITTYGAGARKQFTPNPSCDTDEIPF